MHEKSTLSLPVSNRCNRTPRNRSDRIPAMLGDAGLDALVAVSPENVTYTSGHFEYTLPIIRDRIAATVIPAQGKPAYLVVEHFAGTAREHSWIEDIATFKENAESPIRVLAGILADMGLGEGRVAIEHESLTSGYFEELRGYLPEARFQDGSTILARARAVKTEEEVAFIESAVKATERAHLKVFLELKVGDTEAEIARRLRAQTLLEGADYVNHGIVAAGPNTLEGHHIADQTPIRPGDVVQTDTGGIFGGYYSDISRQVVVGPPSARQRSMWRKLREFQRQGVESMRVGTRAGEAYAHLRRQPGSENILFYGHSLGVFLHDVPMLTAYCEDGLKTTTNRSADWQLQPNMMVMVEFGLADPEGGQRYTFEDLVLVTEKGPRILSNVMDTTDMFVVT